MSKHMDAISAIMRQGLGEDVLEHERKKTAAAIKLATEGHSISSSGDSSVTAEVANGDYGRDCPTANGMNQAAQSMENKWSPGECRVCFAKTMVGSCAVCAGCAAADDRGEDLLKLRDRNLRRQQAKQAIASTSLKQSVEPKSPRNKEDMIRAKYGVNITLKKERTIGGEDTLVLNAVGDVIAKV